MSTEVRAPLEGRSQEILSDEALGFVGELHERFDARRRELLERRVERVARWNAGELPERKSPP